MSKRHDQTRITQANDRTALLVMARMVAAMAPEVAGLSLPADTRRELVTALIDVAAKLLRGAQRERIRENTMPERTVTCPVCNGRTAIDDCLCSGFGWLLVSQTQDPGYHDELVIWRDRMHRAVDFLRNHGYDLTMPAGKVLPHQERPQAAE
jgi:hypothetical protein